MVIASLAPDWRTALDRTLTRATRVLRSTHALLGMTLLFSAGTAAAGVALQRPSPGLVPTLAGTLGPLLAHSLALPGGACGRSTREPARPRGSARASPRHLQALIGAP